MIRGAVVTVGQAATPLPMHGGRAFVLAPASDAAVPWPVLVEVETEDGPSVILATPGAAYGAGSRILSGRASQLSNVSGAYRLTVADRGASVQPADPLRAPIVNAWRREVQPFPVYNNTNQTEWVVDFDVPEGATKGALWHQLEKTAAPNGGGTPVATLYHMDAAGNPVLAELGGYQGAVRQLGDTTLYLSAPLALWGVPDKETGAAGSNLAAANGSLVPASSYGHLLYTSEAPPPRVRFRLTCGSLPYPVGAGDLRLLAHWWN